MIRALPVLCLLAAVCASSDGAIAVPGAQEPPGDAGDPRRPRVVAGRDFRPIQVDGLLDEPAWEGAGVIPDLTQHAPLPGGPAPYRTEVRLLIDRENLFIGIRCFDPDPDKIILHSMRRDIEDPFGDDFITLVLDTYGNRRTAYFFDVHATGALADGLIPGPGLFSTDWDGIWDARTRIDAHGWTVEMRLPSRTLHFRTALDAWGFNVYRYVARDRMSFHWSGVTIDSDILDLSSAGLLSGVGGLEQGRGLTVTPYVLGRFEKERPDEASTRVGRGGLDLSYSLTPGLTAVLTARTDFAETEVDTRQINLTRFDLFFPEKRSFFLEGSNQFSFGLGLEQDFVPFYSRRIGLAGDRVVPIDWGAKILGHAGRLGIAALTIRTGDSTTAQPAALSAARVAWDVGEGFRLGAIGTRGDPEGGDGNALAGVDALWHTSRIRGDKKMSIGGWAARSSRGEPPAGRRDGRGFSIEYPNDFWNASLRYLDLGDALDPAIGFLPRPGIRKYEIWNAVQPRPDRGGRLAWIRQAFFETEFTRVDGLDGRTQSRRLFTAPFNIETEQGDHFEANWAPTYEFLAEPFAIVPGVILPPGGYHFTRYRLEAITAPNRDWRIGSTVWFGGFYDGRLTQTEAFVTWDVLRGRLHQKLDLENDFAHLPEGNFIQRLFQLQNVFAFSPRLLLFGYFQYDTESRAMGMNARLRYTFRPGSDLFVVWNRNWIHPIGRRPFALEPEGDQVALKLRFAWTG